MIKRLFDLTLSAVGLIASAPFWALFALAIKIEDGGAVFFPQARVGLGGRVFTALKFRSMVPDAESCPQLWNILVGDMSFVGPRPLVPGEVEVRGDGRLIPLAEIPGYEARHGIRPGLTGLTQVYAPRDLPRTSKFRLDRLYRERAGVCLDLKLIALSFWITARGSWESRGPKL